MQPASGISPGRTGSGGAGAARNSMLNRGEACLTCRNRKIRCDGKRPSCEPCARAGRADECEYVPTIPDLEEQVRALQERIRELEIDAQRGAPLLPPIFAGQQLLENTGTTFIGPAPQAVALNQQFQSVGGLSSHQFGGEWPYTMPSGPDGCPAAREQLLMQFAQRAHLYGLPPSSVQDLSRHAALGEVARAYEAASTNDDRAFVLRAEAAIARSAPQASTQDVQAMALLASLAFARNRALEGHRHLGAALHVGRALGLHATDPQTWAMVLRAKSEGESHIASAQHASHPFI